MIYYAKLVKEEILAVVTITPQKSKNRTYVRLRRRFQNSHLCNVHIRTRTSIESGL